MPSRRTECYEERSQSTNSNLSVFLAAKLSLVVETGALVELLRFEVCDNDSFVSLRMGRIECGMSKSQEDKRMLGSIENTMETTNSIHLIGIVIEVVSCCSFSVAFTPRSLSTVVCILDALSIMAAGPRLND